jgi:nucleoid DNA-binding protein
MRKHDIVCTIAERTELTQVKTEQVVDAILEEEIKETLSRGESVILRRFATFEVRAKTARKGRNPKTGEPSEITARNVVRFRPGKSLKEAINQGPGST